MALTGQKRSCSNPGRKRKCTEGRKKTGNLGKYKNIVQASKDKARTAIATCNLIQPGMSKTRSLKHIGEIRKTRENGVSLDNTGYIVIQDMEEAEVLDAFFA